eukprot:6847004-Prymnesium_polylepis.1
MASAAMRVGPAAAAPHDVARYARHTRHCGVAGGRIRSGTSRLHRRRPSSPGRRCSRPVSCSS